jgi:hypothetical protein
MTDKPRWLAARKIVENAMKTMKALRMRSEFGSHEEKRP